GSEQGALSLLPAGPPRRRRARCARPRAGDTRRRGLDARARRRPSRAVFGLVGVGRERGLGAALPGPARAAAVVLVILGTVVNALGTFQAEAATFYYVSSTGLARVSRALYEEYPPSFRPPESREGMYRLPRYVPRASDPAFSAFRIHPFLLANRLADHDDDARRRRLSSPPWLATSPDAIPLLLADSPQITTQTPLVRYLASKFRWPH